MIFNMPTVYIDYKQSLNFTLFNTIHKNAGPSQGRSPGGGPRTPGLPPTKLFQIFRLNFSGDMSKMHYFSKKISKLAKHWRLFAFQFWWPEVPWFGQIVVFQADYVEIEL